MCKRKEINLLILLNKYNAIVLCKFRTGNHFLPVETGRWEGIATSTIVNLTSSRFQTNKY